MTTSIPAIAAHWLTSPATQHVFDALEGGGYAARAVGGIVRNTLLGLPETDIDIATTAPPEASMQLCEAAGLKVFATGLEHGTMTVVSGGVPYEVTTLRKDVSTDGRRATVAFTDDWAEDARRRDFTVNALYCDRGGQVFDPLGGMADLEPVRIRFIGDPGARIAEDYLRILRFFRFSAIFSVGGAMDAEGLAACAAHRAGLQRISAERIRVELWKLVVAPAAVPVVREMIACGVYAVTVGHVAHVEALTRLCLIEMLAGHAADPVLRLAALATGNRDDASDLARRLKFSVRDRKRLEGAAGGGLPASDPAGREAKAARVDAYRAGLDAHRDRLLIAWARSAEPVETLVARESSLLLDGWEPPVFPLDGRDAMAAGLAAGPAVGRALRAVEDAWIAGGFAAGRDELLGLLKQVAKAI